VGISTGTGKILSHKHESMKQEAAENAEDKFSTKKPYKTIDEFLWYTRPEKENKYYYKRCDQTSSDA